MRFSLITFKKPAESSSFSPKYFRFAFNAALRKYVLLTKGVGLKDTEKGLRKRKLVRGNTISDEIYQLNCKFDGELKAEEPKVEAKEEKPKEKAK